MNLDILFEKKDEIYIVAGIRDLIKLEKAGIAYSLETYRFAAQAAQSPAAQGGINGDYHSYLELEQDLFLLESSFPELAKVETIGTPENKRPCASGRKRSKSHSSRMPSCQRMDFCGGPLSGRKASFGKLCL